MIEERLEKLKTLLELMGEFISDHQQVYANMVLTESDYFALMEYEKRLQNTQNSEL